MKKMTLSTIVKIGILGALSAVLMNFKFPLPFSPPFMTVDFSDVVSLIGGFALGPMSGILIVLVKNILAFLIFGSMTGGVGEISNFIVGAVFVGVASLIYERNKTKNGAMIGLLVGSLAMTTLAVLSNSFVIFPLYGKILGIDTQAFVEMGASLNGLVSSYFTLMIFAVVPFNLVKSFLVSLVTSLLYKRVSPILKYEGNKKK